MATSPATMLVKSKSAMRDGLDEVIGRMRDSVILRCQGCTMEGGEQSGVQTPFDGRRTLRKLYLTSEKGRQTGKGCLCRR